MTFTTSIKEEIAKQDINVIESRAEVIAFINCIAKIKNKDITLTLENAAVARKIYTELKEIFGINAHIVIRMQRRFKVKQIYILEIKDDLNQLKNALKIENDCGDIEVKN